MMGKTDTHQLDSLLYELHTLSFVLAPSVFVLLCRCITQFQFSRARELDGRRSLRFWFMLVALVNVSAVWAHAFGDGDGRSGGGGAGEEKSVVLDFVGTGHKPTKFQLLLLDATIMFLQAMLTTISYETSLSHAMPSGAPDPLFPASSSISSELSSSGETAPFLPYSSPDTSSIATTASSATTYPPTPPIPTSSSLTTRPDASTDQPSSSSIDDDDVDNSNSNSNNSNAKPTPRDPLPPPIPIIDLSLRRILYRLTSPIPELPSSRTGGANEGLDGGDDELAVLTLPLPNTATVRFAHTLRIFAQARQRQSQREREQQQAARRLRRASRADGGGSGNGNGNGADGEGRGAGRGGGGGPARNREENADGDERRPRTARIPGAIEDEDEG